MIRISMVQTPLSRTAEANKLKELIIRTMMAEGYVTREKGEEFLSKHAIIEHNKGWLGATVDKLINKSETYYRIVKILR